MKKSVIWNAQGTVPQYVEGVGGLQCTKQETKVSHWLHNVFNINILGGEVKFTWLLNGIQVKCLSLITLQLHQLHYTKYSINGEFILQIHQEKQNRFCEYY